MRRELQAAFAATAALAAVLAFAYFRRAAAPGRVPAPPAESCLACHAGLTGFSDAHRPEAIGCAACHRGNPRAPDAVAAHAGMILIPGNLADAGRTCATADCHAAILPRIEQSIMTTFAGAIATDRRVFGEPAAPGAPPPHVRALGHSPADTHFRQLCASCHLGQPKSTLGPLSEQSRGGGCNACHLSYSPAAAVELARYTATPPGDRRVPAVHPALTVRIGNDACFGCHSRSSRISTSYEGWHELREPPPAAPPVAASSAPPFRQLEDGRWFTRLTPDVHHERGLDCIDCHSAAEVMGAGQPAAHKADQLLLRCEDCHAPRLAARPASALDDESRRLAALRRWTFSADQRVATTRSGTPLLNVTIDPAGRGALRRKSTGESLALTPPAAACAAGAGHQRLSCSSCHTAWAPRCASCHTSFDRSATGFDHLSQTDTAGAWTESAGPFQATPPTLGLRLDPRDPAHPAGTVETFVPGMILHLDRSSTPGAAPDRVFRRLYARIAPHTTRREARSCTSCHNDPVALGYGEGTLVYELSGDTGRWRFTPAHTAAPEDGLPADAWIGFLQPRTGPVAARDDVRPFTVDEQRRILRVGACLTCHPGESAVMQSSISNFAALLARRSRQCILPVWP